MIPQEAVEAAAKAMRTEAPLSPSFIAALEAAAPHIQAQALRDAADSIDAGGSISTWLRLRADRIGGGE